MERKSSTMSNKSKTDVAVLSAKMHEEEQKLESLSNFKKNLLFVSKVRNFREQVFNFV